MATTRHSTTRRADRATPEQQVEIAQKVLRVQGPGAWPVCSRRAGLTTANGLAVNPYAGGDRSSRTTTPRPAWVTWAPRA